MLRWSFYPVGSDSYLVVALVAIALLVLLALGPARSKTTPGRRRALVVIRAAIIVMVILAMLRPTLVLMQSRKQSATLVVLADKSRSLSVRGEENGTTRWESQRATLENARGELARIGNDVEVKAYTFDEELHPVAVSDGRIALGDWPDGKQTAIGHALEEVLRQESGKRLLGIIMLSDGAQRAYPPRDVLPQAAAARLKHLGEPLFAVLVGQPRGPGQLQDVAVTDLLTDPTVFVKNELAISAQVRIDGYVNRAIPVKLEVETPAGKTETVAQPTVTATRDGQRIPLNFSYIPETPGEYKVTIKLEEQKEELVTANNRLSTFVQVLKGGVNVLYIEGFPGRPELPALVRSLESSRDVHVHSVLLRRNQENRPADIGEWFKPGKCDVYILGNVDTSAFKPQELIDLTQVVSKGAGLIMLGGLRSFGPGGYGESPLADVLPIVIGRLESQPFDGPVPKDLHLPGPLKIRPTPEGQKRLLRLAATLAESAAIWNKLPPLKDGANRFADVKPNALVLATDDKDHPLLVTQNFGEGRVLAFAGDSTWRWKLRDFEKEHKRFWRQIVLWLAKKDESSEGSVWIKLAQRRVLPGQHVEFTVGAQSPSGEPASNAVFQVEVEAPGSKKSVLHVVRDAEGTSGSFRETEQPGDYTIRVTATQDGRELGAAKSRFLVVEQDLELDNPTADATLMENLATSSGGKAIVPEELPALIRQLAANTQELEVQTETKRTFWDTWPFFLVFVGLLGVEWYLRKRWGLV